MEERNFLNLVLAPCYDGNVKEMKVASIDVRDGDIISNLVENYYQMMSEGVDDYDKLRTYIPKTTNSRVNNIIYSPYVGKLNPIRTGYYSKSPYGDCTSKYKSCEGILVEITKYGTLYYSTMIEGQGYSWQIRI